MNIVEENHEGCTVLRPEGRLDSIHGPVLEEALQGLLERGTRRIVIDLSEVSYVSSRGLRAFLVCAKRAAAAGGRLVVCSAQEFVRNAFLMTGMHGLLGGFETCADAVSSLASEEAASEEGPQC